INLRDAGLPAFSNALKQIDFLQIATRPAGFEEVDLSGEAFLSVDRICMYTSGVLTLFFCSSTLSQGRKSRNFRCSALPFLFSAFEDRLPVFPLRADLLSQKCSTPKASGRFVFLQNGLFL
ncbi:MAG: hypothetical protein J6J31_02550, partial [Thermoguttaceae bacterium]|nr:hypothetical protein [Thermoguttaceae bacterium]